MPSPLPRLRNYFASAVGPGGDWSGDPVFALSYGKGETFDWGDPVPDQISPMVQAQTFEAMSSDLVRGEHGFSTKFALNSKVSAGGSWAGNSVEGSVAVALTQESKLFRRQSSYYMVNYVCRRVATFRRTELTPLDERFQRALRSLPAGERPPREPYEAFFDRYGTHYAERGSIGGLVYMVTEIKKSLIEKMTKKQVKTKVDAAFKNAAAKVSASIETEYATSQTDKDVTESTTSTFKALGGSGSTKTPLTEWMESVDSKPVLLEELPGVGDYDFGPVLVNISHLVDSVDGCDPAIKRHLDDFAVLYIRAKGMPAGPKRIFSEPEPRPEASGLLRMARPGFIVASLGTSGKHDRGQVAVSDSAWRAADNTVAIASEHLYRDHDHWVGHSALTIPARAGGSYQLAVELPTGRPTVGACIVEFTGLGEPTLDWTAAYSGTRDSTARTVALEQEHVAKTDGFVVASIDWDQKDGARGVVYGEQMLDGEKYEAVAAASQHYFRGMRVGANSFMMPVRRKTKFRIRFEPTSLRPLARALFVKLGGNVRMGGPETLELERPVVGKRTNRAFADYDDGLVVSYLKAGTNGARGSVFLTSWPLDTEEGEGEAIPVRASTSVHLFKKSDTWVGHNSVTVPVWKEGWFELGLHPTVPGTECATRFWRLSQAPASA